MESISLNKYILKRTEMYSVLTDNKELTKSIYILDKAYNNEMEIRNERV